MYAQLLTGRKYQINQNGEVRLEKQWSKQVLPFVYQTIVKVSLRSQFYLNVCFCTLYKEKTILIFIYRQKTNSAMYNGDYCLI